MVKINPRSTRAAVARSLREVATLWARPPDPGPRHDNGHEQVAEVGTDQQNELRLDHTPVAPVKRGVR